MLILRFIMRLKIKGAFVLAYLFCSTFLMAQNGVQSPYSAFGLGDYFGNSGLRNQGMGGLGVALGDRNYLNLANPASFSSLEVTTFEISGYARNTRLASSTDKSTTFNGGYNCLAFAFPTRKKLTFAAGIEPFSRIGYSFTSSGSFSTPDDTVETRTARVGEGGLNKAFVGIGMKIFKPLSLGANLHYTFGNLTKTEEHNYFFTNASSIVNQRIQRFNGFSAKFGLQFADSVGRDHSNPDTLHKEKKYLIRFGLSANMGGNLKTNQVHYYQFYGSPSQTDTIGSIVNGKSQMPSSYTAGFTIESQRNFKNKNFFVFSVEAEYFDNNRFNILGIKDTSFTNGIGVRIGSEWTPSLNGTHIFAKSAYRIGLKYEQTPLVIENKRINLMALTLGIGMPFRSSFFTVSRLNIGFEAGTKGSKANNLVQESYFVLSLGITFNELWFIKRKFD